MSASVLSGSPAVVSYPVGSAALTFPSSGTATIAQNTQAIAVVDPRITASSLVIVSFGFDNGALATQPGHAVCLQPGVGFTIRSTAIATNPGTGLVCNYAVLKY